MSNWYVGDLPQIEVNATDPRTSTPVTPTSVSIRVIAPSGQEETLAMAKVGEGRYILAIELTEEGPYRTIIEATGSYQGIKREVISARTP